MALPAGASYRLGSPAPVAANREMIGIALLLQPKSSGIEISTALASKRFAPKNSLTLEDFERHDHSGAKVNPVQLKGRNIGRRNGFT
jgi:hypothetical protein